MNHSLNLAFGASGGTGRWIGLSIIHSAVGLAARVTLLTLLLGGCQPRAADPAAEEVLSAAERLRSPLEVVNLRMRAYNEHDLATFLSTYSEEVEIFTYPEKFLGKGKQRLEKLFEQPFRDGAVHVEIHHQITKDSYVINHETVVWDDETIQYVSIYEVRKGLIRSVRFVRD